MVAKYGQPQRATISFGNPYIPWHDNIIPGGKLGQQLTIMADGHCRVESFVFNRDQWRPITSAAPDELTIPAPQAAQLLKRLLEVMNYFGQPHPADSAPTPTNGRATTIWNAAGQATSFTGYLVDEEEIEPGDTVIVSVGPANQEEVMVVADKHYYTEDKVPLPAGPNQVRDSQGYQG